MSEFQPGDLVAGRLRIVRELGAGGMGAVYEVEHEVTKHRRALKLLHAEFAQNPAIVKRFLNEASAAGRIGNSHIVETFDGGQLEGGEPYLVMEMLEGGSLREVLDERGTLPVVEAIEMIQQACEGITAAHGANIIHRDLKPDNLFLVSGERPFVKILDFGVSKFEADIPGAQPLTAAGGMMGTPHYMPPEQMRGEVVGPSADVYALGVVLYESLGGRRPYDAETLAHLSVLVHAGESTPLSELRGDLPAGLDSVIRRAMSADAVSRYPSAAALSESLALVAETDAPSLATVSPEAVVRARGAEVSAAPTMAAPAHGSGAGSAPGSEIAETQLPLPQTAAAIANTAAGSANTVDPTREAPRSKQGLVMAALGVVAVAGIVLVALRSPDDSGPSGPTTEPGNTAPGALDPEPASTAPQVAPTTSSEPEIADAAPPPPSAPDAAPTATPPKTSAKPTARPTGTGKPPATRSGKHGLAQENPF